jgi:FkbM family methyltransferase
VHVDRVVAFVRQSLGKRPVAFRYASRALSVARFIARRPHESDYEVFRRLPPGMVIADVGANRGQSALAFASLCPGSQVVSFEPNPLMERDLRLVKRILRRRFDYHLCGLADTPSTLVLHVPLRGGREVSGEASFDRSQLDRAVDRIGQPFTVQERHVPVRRIDDYGLSPDVVKIDVQGFELSVIRGMGETLQRSRPLLLVEASLQNDAAVRAELRARGYEVFQARGDRLVSPGGPRPLNWFYLPTERDPRFEVLHQTG